MKIIELKDKSSLNTSVAVLKSGGVIVFPTDTVYGIGCILDETAIRKLYKIKNRSLSKPTAILFSRKQISNILPSSVKSSINVPKDYYTDFKNGTVTLILLVSDLKKDFPKLLIKDGKIGIRIPSHKWLEKLIEKVGPIVASSANITGGKTPTKFDEIEDIILKKADLVIKTNVRMSGKSSAVYDLENNKYLRK